jgi:hypothetical protein
VGDTFRVGCAYSDNLLYSEYFKTNPDYINPDYRTKQGEHSPLPRADRLEKLRPYYEDLAAIYLLATLKIRIVTPFRKN